MRSIDIKGIKLQLACIRVKDFNNLNDMPTISSCASPNASEEIIGMIKFIVSIVEKKGRLPLLNEHILLSVPKLS